MVDATEYLLKLDNTIRQAIACIDQGRFGIAIVVDGDGKLLGTITDGDIRRRLFKQGLDFGMQPVFVCHSQAVISPTAQIGQGVTIMAGAVINSGVVIGDNVIVNTGAIVEHDCFLGDHTHVATGARLAGGVRVNTGAHIGIGATVRELIQIGDHAIVGAGAGVVKSVRSKTVVVGVPARPLVDSNEDARVS